MSSWTGVRAGTILSGGRLRRGWLAAGLMLLAAGAALGQPSVADLSARLKSPDANIRLAALVGLADQALAARTQIQDREKADAMMAALRKTGPQVAELVGDRNPLIRQAAIRALALARTEGKIFAKAVDRGLVDSDPRVRMTAAEALGDFVEIRNVGNQLAERIQQSDRIPLARLIAADGAALVSVLEVALKLGSADERAAAIRSLKMLIGTMADLPPLLSIDIDPKDPNVKTLQESLLKLVGEFNAIAPSLNALLLGRHGPDQIEAAQVIERLANLRDRLAQPDLEAFGKKASDLQLQGVKRTLPGLAHAVSSPDDQVQIAALEALEAIGEPAASERAAILRALGDDNRFVRWSAARALSKIKAQDETDVVAGLAKMLSDEDMDLRSVAAQSLSLLKDKARPATQALAQASTRVGDPELQVNAVRALIAIKPEAAAVVPAMIQALGSPEVRVRRLVPVLLGSLGAQANSALPALQQALLDSDLEVRQAATEAVLKIAGGK